MPQERTGIVKYRVYIPSRPNHTIPNLLQTLIISTTSKFYPHWHAITQRSAPTNMKYLDQILPDKSSTRGRVQQIRNNTYIQMFIGGMKLVLSDPITKAASLFLFGVLFLAIFGPTIAPYEASEQFYNDDGTLKTILSPMTDGHILGTTERGQDNLSRLLIGARATTIVGLASGLIIITCGTLIGVTAGYSGGTQENILMRFTDFAYGIPLVPFAIVMSLFLGVGFWTTILVIGLVLWRGSARVLRSQVLQIKQRPYIQAARATGAGPIYIVRRHILPNIATMIVLFFALGIGASILVQANLAFIGISNPFIPSWGIMVRNAYQSGIMQQVWWWSLPPGFLIAFTVLSTFLLGRGYERIASRETTKEVGM